MNSDLSVTLVLLLSRPAFWVLMFFITLKATDWWMNHRFAHGSLLLIVGFVCIGFWYGLMPFGPKNSEYKFIRSQGHRPSTSLFR